MNTVLEQREPAQEVPTETSAKKVHHVLFVDDEKFILRAMQRLFRSETNYECHFAEGPAIALSIIKDEPIEVAVCDHRMPQMEGAEFIARLKKKRPNIVCIMLTGQANLNDVQKAVNEGDIYKFLMKPWDDDELKQIVADAVEKYASVKDEKIRTRQSAETERVLMDDNRKLKESVDERTEQLICALETARQANETLRSGLYDVARTFSSILELARPDIGTHAKRVAKIAVDLSHRARMPIREESELEIAALLHDIGAIGLPPYLLERSNDNMNDAELKAYETHPQQAFENLKHISGFENISKYILHHHERYNGSGFPSRLRDSDIPLQAYMLGIADEYDHLINRVTSDPVLLFERSYEKIEGMSDVLFPHKVVRWMLAIMDKNRLSQVSPNAREVGVLDLAPNMIIARNVYTIGGTLLAAANTLLDHKKILRIRSVDRVDSVAGKILVTLESQSDSGRK